MRRAVFAAGCCAVLSIATVLAVLRAAPAPAVTTARSSVVEAHAPVLAYYYIWFDTTSWRRAKTDYPVFGRYSSDDAAVMREQVRLAKRAGIDGFIVSWKHTPTLDRRLAQLTDIAEQEHFKLAIIYQGLDFHRRPQPTDTVARDLGYFAVTFSGRAPFKIFAKPVVIWSGTWEFSAADVARVTEPVRAAIAVLASEKNIAGYERIAPFVDGDAYYWSSVNPATYRGYIEKLTDLGGAVHGDLGLWIAPAAVGFDARKVGGTTVVGRAGGATLLTQIDAALASSPDALGLISWNEYSENSHLEPSVNYGYSALDVVGRRLGAGAVSAGVSTGSSGRQASRASAHRPSPPQPSGPSGPIVLVVFGSLIGLLAFVGVRRARRTTQLRVVGASAVRRTVRTPGPPVRPPTRQEIVAARRRARRAGVTPPGGAPHRERP
jgi:hypothetical protein